jgi:hypothetical protein
MNHEVSSQAVTIPFLGGSRMFVSRLSCQKSWLMYSVVLSRIPSVSVQHVRKNNQHKHNLCSWCKKHACKQIEFIGFYLSSEFCAVLVLREWWGRAKKSNFYVRLKANHKIVRPNEQAAQSGTHTAHGNSHHAATMPTLQKIRKITYKVRNIFL